MTQFTALHRRDQLAGLRKPRSDRRITLSLVILPLDSMVVVTR
jgi:hypothetical protein